MRFAGVGTPWPDRHPLRQLGADDRGVGYGSANALTGLPSIVPPQDSDWSRCSGCANGLTGLLSIVPLGTDDRGVAMEVPTA
jgi:hypothetical protein